jgi:hypothetical protein
MLSSLLGKVKGTSADEKPHPQPLCPPYDASKRGVLPDTAVECAGHPETPGGLARRMQTYGKSPDLRTNEIHLHECDRFWPGAGGTLGR